MRSRITLGLLGLLSLFVLVSLIIAWPQLQAQAQDTSALEEVVSLRARNRKVFRHVGWSQAVDGWQLERYTMQVSVGSLHYLDENGQWQDVDATPVDTGTEYRVDKVNAPVRLPKVATAPMVIKVGNETVTVRMVGAEPVAASLQGNRVLFADVYPQTDIAYEAEADGVREFLTLKGPGHPSTFVFRVETPLAMSVEQGEVLFRSKEGQAVGKLYRPFVTASPTETRWGELSLDGNVLTMSLPDLTGLSYPITVDPTVQDTTWDYMNTGSHDGYAVPAWQSWNSTDIRVNFGKGINGETYETTLHFDNVEVPHKTEIVTATVTFVADNTQSNTSTKVRIRAEDDGDPDVISSYSDWGDANRTSAYVDWTIPAWTLNDEYTTPNIADVIQAVVDKSDWGYRLNLFFDDNGSSTSATRSAYSYNGNSSKAPYLTVTFNVFRSHFWVDLFDNSTGTSKRYIDLSDVGKAGQSKKLEIDYAVDYGSGFGAYTTTLMLNPWGADAADPCTDYDHQIRTRASISTAAENLKWRVTIDPGGGSLVVKDSNCDDKSISSKHVYMLFSPNEYKDVDSKEFGLGIFP